MASTVAAVGRAAPALLRWATVAQPGVAARSASTSMGAVTVTESTGPPGPGRRSDPVGSGRDRALRTAARSVTSIPIPLVQFGRWFDDAATVVAAPEAMAVATVDADGRPSARMVLLKAWGEDGFVFHTNYDSRKGRELAANPHAALLFYWEPRGRQVRIEGTVERTGAEESDAYFATRPRGAQIGAHASHQSQVDREPRAARRRGRAPWRPSSPVARCPAAGVVGRRPGRPRVLRVLAEPRRPPARPAPLPARARRVGDRPAPALTPGRPRPPGRTGLPAPEPGNRREYVLGMADETTLVNDRTGQLLDEIDPRASTVEEFRSRQFELGLAWVSFPEGYGGLGLPPNLQREVDRRLAEAGATPPGAREFFGLTMAGPTVVTHGSEELRRAHAATDLHRRGVVVPAVQRARVPARTWPDWPPGPSATGTSG